MTNLSRPNHSDTDLVKNEWQKKKHKKFVNNLLWHWLEKDIKQQWKQFNLYSRQGDNIRQFTCLNTKPDDTLLNSELFKPTKTMITVIREQLNIWHC